MSNFIKFLVDHLSTIIPLVLLLVSAVTGTKLGWEKLISQGMLFVQKETTERMKTGGYISGAERKAAVINYVYNKFPSFLKRFLKVEFIGRKIDQIIIDLEDLKDDGILNASSKEGEKHD